MLPGLADYQRSKFRRPAQDAQPGRSNAMKKMILSTVMGALPMSLPLGAMAQRTVGLFENN
jgi:hypothetical protein